MVQLNCLNMYDTLFAVNGKYQKQLLKSMKRIQYC